MSQAKPFLKWAGNKYRVLKHIKPLLPADAKRYVEPFAGSCAVFLNVDYPKYLISEKNPDLVNLYKLLQSEGHAFIDYIQSFHHVANNDEDIYYELREQFNRSNDPQLRSALFIYFNRHGYNGLCRYNSSGEFNVPFGRYTKPYFPRKELEHFVKHAKKANFICQDYLHTMKKVKAGDIVYCDPPYIPLSQSASFTRYQGDAFDEQDQIRLAQAAKKAVQKGATVIISNHDTPLARELYAEAEIIAFSVDRFISCDGDSRRPAREILAVFA